MIFFIIVFLSGKLTNYLINTYIYENQKEKEYQLKIQADKNKDNENFIENK